MAHQLERIKIVVEGIARPRGSKTGYYIPKLRRVAITDTSQSRHYMDAVRVAAVEQYGGPILIGAVELSVRFLLPRPKSHYRTGRHARKLRNNAPKYHKKKPDLSKLLRGVEDALSGVVYRDDSQIAQYGITEKVYTEEPPQTLISVRSLELTLELDSINDTEAKHG